MKQKHWILTKYAPAWPGCTLKVAMPVEGDGPAFLTRKNTVWVSPRFAAISRLSGVNRQSRPGATLASNRTDRAREHLRPTARRRRAAYRR